MDSIVKGVLICLGIIAVGIVIWLLVVNLQQNIANSSAVASNAAALASTSQPQQNTVIVDRTIPTPFYYNNSYIYGQRFPRPYIPTYNWPVRWRR